MAITEQKRYLIDLANTTALLTGTRELQLFKKAVINPETLKYHQVTTHQTLWAMTAGIISSHIETQKTD